ncbi:MAG TPA: BadF/BadG/BcrA/BcrD ATPase family protein [Vicinamibacterales bacterium]|nr:BadF/BadG/BcrA/BcrD ATPase family protein [Vicinamibacterales bacterium]
MRYASRTMSVLGIDAGGTRTMCVLADDAGQVLAEARGPGANLQSVGELEVEKVLHDLIAQAMGTSPAPAAICLGMAGVDRPQDAEVIRGILRRIGQRARVVVVNDALIALEAGVPGRPGTVVIAGTGSIAYGRSADGRGARAGGWGYVLGDEGSGYWLGRLALRAVLRAADGRGEQTDLTARVLAHYGVEKPRDLVREIYEGGTRPSAIACLAREVGAAADAGDGIAGHLVTVAAQELAKAVHSVASRLSIEAEPVVLSGGTLLGLGQLRRQVTRELSRLLPESRVVPLETDPAHGAVHLARAALSGALQLPAYNDAF